MMARDIQEYGKSLVASKQVWANILTGILTASDLLPAHIGLPINLAANLILRVFFTAKPITSVLPK